MISLFYYMGKVVENGVTKQLLQIKENFQSYILARKEPKKKMCYKYYSITCI